jgi:hypothetical protein
VTIALNSINQVPGFVMEKSCVFFEIGTIFLILLDKIWLQGIRCIIEVAIFMWKLSEVISSNTYAVL